MTRLWNSGGRQKKSSSPKSKSHSTLTHSISWFATASRNWASAVDGVVCSLERERGEGERGRRERGGFFLPRIRRIACERKAVAEAGKGSSSSSGSANLG